MNKRKWDENPFGKIVNGLTAVADFAVDKLPLPGIVKEGYKRFGPPTSKYYDEKNLYHQFTGEGMPAYLNKRVSLLFN